MKRVGIVSYNMYGNFTNYGSALQSYALHKTIDRIAPGEIESIVVDYCPDVLADKDVLNPMGNMWDTDAESRERCRLSLPAIRENYDKFCRFYKEQYRLSGKKYTSGNFNESLDGENLQGYVCGSDTVFAVPEFGFDDGFYANYECMRHRSVAYAASFGDYDIEPNQICELKQRLVNFNAIALRENDKKVLVEGLVSAPVYQVIDPTLLLTADDYAPIIEPQPYTEPYILLYSRRQDNSMMEFAERKAKALGVRIVEISLNAHNEDKHIMRYDAGVEEFLGLVKGAKLVITNSFHGMIFAVQFCKPFYIFSRKLCNTKISELLELFGISERLMTTGDEPAPQEIDYKEVHQRIREARAQSIQVLSTELKSYL